jgi:hypothetical protein
MKAEELWHTTALIYVDNGQYYTVSRRTPDKEVWPNPFMLAWVTNVIWTSNLVQVVLEQTTRLVENFVYEATNSEQLD